MQLDQKKARQDRYLDKIAHGEKRYENIIKWLQVLKKHDELTLLAIYKATQELIESLMDILAMILKDTNNLPKDDYSNIEKAFEQEILSEEETNILREANGLRNRLIHSYNGINDELALKSLKKLLPGCKQILARVKEWIKNY